MQRWAQNYCCSPDSPLPLRTLSQVADNVANARTEITNTWCVLDTRSNAPFDEPTDASTDAPRMSTIGTNALVLWYDSAGECAIPSHIGIAPDICRNNVPNESHANQVQCPILGYASSRVEWLDHSPVENRAVSHPLGSEQYPKTLRASPYARS